MIKRRIIPMLLVLALMMGLIACGARDLAGDNASPPPPTQQTTAGTQTDAGETTGTPETGGNGLYEKTDMDRLFAIHLPETQGFLVDQGSLVGDYGLLRLRRRVKGLEEVKLLLFCLTAPDQRAVMPVSDVLSTFFLLPQGEVLEINHNNALYRIYRSDFTLACQGETGGQTYLGHTGKSELWFFDAGEKTLSLLSGGQTLFSAAAPGIQFASSYLGETDDRAYFHFVDSGGYSAIGILDRASGQFDTDASLPRSPAVFGNRLSYASDSKWYLASVDRPNVVTSFEKIAPDESIWRMDEQFVITQRYAYAEDGGLLDEQMLIYDVSNGGLCQGISTSQLPNCRSMGLLGFSNGRILLQAAMDDESHTLYLYDIGGMSAESASPSYQVMDISVDESEVGRLARALEETYGVTVIYDAFGLAEFEFDQKLTVCEESEALIQMLNKLNQCLAEYPDGFLRELKGNSKKALKIYLSGPFVPTGPDAAAHAIGAANATGEYLSLALDTRYTWDLRKTLVHEMMHLMECRIEEYAACHHIDPWGYWEKHLNTPEYPYLYSYAESGLGIDIAATAMGGYDNPWFIDTYAKTNPLEDRARTLEYMLFDSNAGYYQGEHMKAKAQFLSALIRETFPSVAACQNPILWERRTGIVELGKVAPSLKPGQG
nr:hypothetical protein [bacterium]